MKSDKQTTEEEEMTQRFMLEVQQRESEEGAVTKARRTKARRQKRADKSAPT